MDIFQSIKAWFTKGEVTTQKVIAQIVGDFKSIRNFYEAVKKSWYIY